MVNNAGADCGIIVATAYLIAFDELSLLQPAQLGSAQSCPDSAKIAFEAILKVIGDGVFDDAGTLTVLCRLKIWR